MGVESLQLGSIIKALETQTLELKSALAGLRDAANTSDSIGPIPYNRGQWHFMAWFSQV